MTQIRLWFIRETEKGRFYSKLPPERHPGADDCVWVPKSIIEHTRKDGAEHYVDLPDWFVERENL